MITKTLRPTRHGLYSDAMPKRLSGVVAALVGTFALLTLLATPTAQAITPTLPQCTSITDLNCQGTFANLQAGDRFVQIVNGATTNEDVWPFRNPTAGPWWTHIDDATMFPADYPFLRASFTSLNAKVSASQTAADASNALVAEQRQTIMKQSATIARLKARIAKLQARLNR